MASSRANVLVHAGRFAYEADIRQKSKTIRARPRRRHVGGCDLGVTSSISSALMVVRVRSVQANIGTTARPDKKIVSVAREGRNTYFGGVSRRASRPRPRRNFR